MSYAWCAECQHVRKSNVHCPMIEVPMSDDPRPHDFIHGHQPDGPHDPFEVVLHNMGALILAIQSLENRLERVEYRLTVVERATPLKRPKR